MKTSVYSCAAAFLLLAAPSFVIAQTTWDFGATPDQNWSSVANWSTDLSPAATAVIFGATGVTANATTVGNIVDTSYTSTNSLSSLTYNANSASWQVTQIASGQTLTVGGAFLVGGLSGGTSTQTKTAFTGTGSLVINNGSSLFSVSNNSPGSGGVPTAILDLSNLSTFSATVSAFNYGNGTNGSGTVYLSDNSTITATTLTGGGTGTYGSWNSGITNQLVLGSATVMNVDSIAFATGRTRGTVAFRPATSGAANTGAATTPSLTIRGTAGGTSRAALSIGDVSEGGAWSPAGAYTSTADFSAGTVDAQLSTLTVGYGRRGLGGTNSYTGKMILAAGTGSAGVDATTVIVGQQAGNSADGAATATMNGWLQITAGDVTAGSVTLANNTAAVLNNLNGQLDVSGTANVHVTGNLVIGRRTTGTNAVSAILNISGGSLTIDGTLAESGSNLTSTVNLSGGTLDMTRGDVAVDTFNFTGGTLKNVASFTGNLNAQNSATLGFDAVDGSFTAMTLTGSLTLGANSNLSLSLANGFTPVSGFTLIDNDGTGDSITGTFATVNGGAFGSGNSFSLTNNTGTYNFTLNYAGGDGNDLVATLSMIPEPSTYAALVGVMAVGFSVWRRRR
jgi:hypothetical protein